MSALFAQLATKACSASTFATCHYGLPKVEYALLQNSVVARLWLI